MTSEIHRYAGVILVTPHQEILLQQRDNDTSIQNPGAVSFFGGAVETNEEPLQAARRELREELELELSDSDLEYYGNFKKIVDLHGVDRDCYIYLAKNIDPAGLKILEGKKIIKLHSPNDLVKFKLSLLAKEVLTKYFSK